MFNCVQETPILVWCNKSDCAQIVTESQAQTSFVWATYGVFLKWPHHYIIHILLWSEAPITSLRQRRNKDSFTARGSGQSRADCPVLPDAWSDWYQELMSGATLQWLVTMVHGASHSRHCSWHLRPAPGTFMVTIIFRQGREFLNGSLLLWFY